MNILGHVVRRRVVITLKSGTSVMGVVTSAKRSFCLVRDASVMERGGQPMPADGEVLVEREHIDYIQIPGA